jgi:16S rRNA (guanine(966)-N(2))-methyltransferase RsmD
VIDARVLDLFAGTGALGIEALSRGAASAMFVEENRAAAQVIEQNFVRTKVRGRIRTQEVFAFLESAGPKERFDIILADPPYEKTRSGGEFTRLLLESQQLADLLEPSGILVIEKRPDEQVVSSGLWKTIRAKKYGATEVLFLVHSDATKETVSQAE